MSLLTIYSNRVYSGRNAATTAGGFGDPDSLADDRRTSAVFFRPLRGTSYGRAMWETREGLPVPTTGSPTRMVPLTRLATVKREFKPFRWSSAMAHLTQGASARRLDLIPCSATAVNLNGELRVKITPRCDDEWYGTAAQLQEEGLIPPGFEWPEKKASKDWEENGLYFSLSRTRPAGARGSRGKFDYWVLQRSHLKSFYDRLSAARIYEKTNELKRELWMQSEKGREEWMSQCNASSNAARDKDFQEFLVKVGLKKLSRRGRPAKNHSTEQ
jgi:hypothetical protein